MTAIPTVLRPRVSARAALAARKRQSFRDQIIERNLGLVRHIVGKLLVHLPAGVDVENLTSAGTLGLVEAASKFDPDRGIKFETYSYTRIRGAVLDELRRNCPLPQYMLEQAARVRKACNDLGQEASLAAVADRTGLSAEQVADCLSALRMSRVLSLDRQQSPACYFIPDRGDLPDIRAEKEEQKRLLTEAIANLPKRERLVVTLYYMEDLRLREIGEVLELSESRVCRLMSSAMLAVRRFIQMRNEVHAKELDGSPIN